MDSKASQKQLRQHSTGVKQMARGKLFTAQEAQPVLCDDLERWDGSGAQEAGRLNIRILMADHAVVWKKPTQHYKAVIFQENFFLIKKKKRKDSNPRTDDKLDTGRAAPLCCRQVSLTVAR